MNAARCRGGSCQAVNKQETLQNMPTKSNRQPKKSKPAKGSVKVKDIAPKHHPKGGALTRDPETGLL